MSLRLALAGPLTTLLMQHSLVPSAAARWLPRPGAQQRSLALARSARLPQRPLATAAASGSKFGGLPDEPDLPFAVGCGWPPPPPPPAFGAPASACGAAVHSREQSPLLVQPILSCANNLSCAQSAHCLALAAHCCCPVLLRTTAASTPSPILQVYTPEENAAYWQTRPVAVVTRTLQISAALGGCCCAGGRLSEAAALVLPKLLDALQTSGWPQQVQCRSHLDEQSWPCTTPIAGSWLMEGRLTNRGAGQQELTDVRADKLRRLLTELGPAFVKIGQAVSSRGGVGVGGLRW